MSLTKAVARALLVLVTALLWPCPLTAAPVAVRFAAGVTHGFLLLRTVDGGLIASGDLLQVGRGGTVKSRMVFRFNRAVLPVQKDLPTWVRHRTEGLAWRADNLP